MEEQVSEKEINTLAIEEAEKDINNLDNDLHILFEQEDKTMKNPRKLSYSEHWKRHWKKKIAEQYVFFSKWEVNKMRNIKLEWTIEGLENGFLVPSLEIPNKKFFEKLEDAKNHLKKQIDEDCQAEFEEEDA